MASHMASHKALPLHGLLWLPKEERRWAQPKRKAESEAGRGSRMLRSCCEGENKLPNSQRQPCLSYSYSCWRCLFVSLGIERRILLEDCSASPKVSHKASAEASPKEVRVKGSAGRKSGGRSKRRSRRSGRQGKLYPAELLGRRAAAKQPAAT